MAYGIWRSYPSLRAAHKLLHLIRWQRMTERGGGGGITDINADSEK